MNYQLSRFLACVSRSLSLRLLLSFLSIPPSDINKNTRTPAIRDNVLTVLCVLFGVPSSISGKNNEAYFQIGLHVHVRVWCTDSLSLSSYIVFIYLYVAILYSMQSGRFCI